MNAGLLLPAALQQRILGLAGVSAAVVPDAMLLPPFSFAPSSRVAAPAVWTSAQLDALHSRAFVVLDGAVGSDADVSRALDELRDQFTSPEANALFARTR